MDLGSNFPYKIILDIFNMMYNLEKNLDSDINMKNL